GNNSGGGIVVAVGASGRVLADGSLAQTGGGDLNVSASFVGSGGNKFINLRGDIHLKAGAFGTLTATEFGSNGLTGSHPRALDALPPYGMTSAAGGSFGVGDGAVTIHTRGDLAMGEINDPGRVGVIQSTAATANGQTGDGVSWFTLWTDRTAIDLFAGGGDI